MRTSILTTPPSKHVVLYDGRCAFCTARMKNLLALARPGAIEAVDFQQPGVLARFPGLAPEACMQAMHLVTPDGQVYRGFEAAVRAAATRPVLGLVAWAYYLPGIRQVCDRLYRFLAARRYRLGGRAVPGCGCAAGTCTFPVPPARSP